MGISVIGAAASSGGGGGGDFVINTGDYNSDTAELSTEFAAGAYGITVSPTDATLDIYLVASDGSFAGYTNTGSITATIPFDKVVVLGSTASTSLSFVFNGESQTATTKGQLGGAGAVISSVVTSSLPSVDDTTVVNGGNFAADVEVSFIDQSAVETAAKTVVRSSSTQLIITRPDFFSPGDSPYTIKVVNPGVPVPSSTNPHLLSNSVTAGTNPVWTTGTTLLYFIGAATSQTLLATDTEATDIDYSIVSGTLPAGLALDGETGVVSGTFSGTASDGDVTAVTIRATDTGGNFLDKAFDFTANEAPTWTTAAGALLTGNPGAAYSLQLAAASGNAGGALTYTVQSGALVAGHSLSSTGLISGTSTAPAGDTAAFTVRATDEGGLFVDRSFTITLVYPLQVEFVVVAGGGGGGTGYGGAGGAGGYRSSVAGEQSGGGYSALSLFIPTPGTSYSISVGAGGAAGNTSYGPGSNGSNSAFHSYTATGGGRGGYGATSGNDFGANGGSGGGASANRGNFPGGSGTAGQGFAGASNSYGPGGGAGSAATTLRPGNGVQSSITGTAIYRAGGGQAQEKSDSSGGLGGGGSYPATAGASNSGGGGAAGNISPTSYGPGGAGGSGVVILSYPNNYSPTFSAGLSRSTTTVGIKTVVQINSGSGTVTW
jgi:hypothetical protein